MRLLSSTYHSEVDSEQSKSSNESFGGLVRMTSRSNRQAGASLPWQRIKNTCKHVDAFSSAHEAEVHASRSPGSDDIHVAETPTLTTSTPDTGALEQAEQQSTAIQYSRRAHMKEERLTGVKWQSRSTSAREAGSLALRKR
jgi:hypothetical protein